MEASALADKLGAIDVVDPKVLDPDVQCTAEKHFIGSRWARAKQVLLFFASHVGEYITYKMIMEGTGLDVSSVQRSLKVLIARSNKFPKEFGFILEKTILPEKRGQQSSGGPVKLHGARAFILKKTIAVDDGQGGQLEEADGVRAIILVPGSAYSVMPITDDVRYRALSSLKKEFKVRGVSIAEVPPKSAGHLLSNAGWMIRPEQREDVLVQELFAAAQVRRAGSTYKIFIDNAFPSNSRGGFHLLEARTLPRALELGFFVMNVGRGAFAIFFLDPKQREEMLLKKYPNEDRNAALIYLDKVVPFKPNIFKSRCENSMGLLSPRCRSIARIVRRDFMAGKPTQQKELREQIHMTQPTVRLRLQEMAERRFDTWMYVRARPDRRLEPVLLDIKAYRKEEYEDAAFRRDFEERGDAAVENFR